jgi:hypothetical protein
MSGAFIRFLKNPFHFYEVSILPKLYEKSPYLKRRRKLSDLQKKFIDKLSRLKINWDKNKQKVVLAQSVSDYEMCVKIASLSNQLAKTEQANIAIYSAEYFKKPKNTYARYFSKSQFKTNLDKIYLSFAGKVIYRNNDEWKDIKLVDDEFNRIVSTIKNKYDVLEIKIENCKIGDLIYDTYLRYANKPEVNIDDDFLKILIRQSINIYFVSKYKIEEYHVCALVSSYTTYIYHGISVRICLNKNIPVYTIGAYYSLNHKVSKEYPSHANNHFNFKQLFATLPNQEEIIQNYTSLFEKRFEGVIDSATTYMKQSAFSNQKNEELNNIDWKNTVVILAHCFFDSPHIYRDLLFPDFYEWMNFTLSELIKQTDLTIIVKQHPNGLPENDDIFNQLKQNYTSSKILFIDKKTSQLQIIQSRPKAIITAYGTAAAEFSYQGFPVLTIYDNPFTAYDFTYLAKSKDEYKLLLADILNLQPKQNKLDVIEYYYMQHFHFLNGRNVDYLMCSKYKGQTFSEDFLNDYLPKMDDNYFNALSNAMKDGLKICEWEEKMAIKN